MSTLFSDYSLLFKDMFPRDRLAFGTDIGTGWFGKVGHCRVGLYFIQTFFQDGCFCCYMIIWLVKRTTFKKQQRQQ